MCYEKIKSRSQDQTNERFSRDNFPHFHSKDTCIIGKYEIYTGPEHQQILRPFLCLQEWLLN